MSSFKIHKHGFWESKDSTGHLYDHPLSNALMKLFASENAHSIIDFGCGMGYYTKALREAGYECDGYDGNPNTVELSHGFGKVLDLSVPIDLQKKYNWVLSLEVGEHIPQKFENIFLDNLIDHAETGAVISWAIPGQRGDGHVNCRSNKYIIRQMKKRGWKIDKITTNELRKESTLNWFKNTIMVFRKRNDSKNILQNLKSFFNQVYRIITRSEGNKMRSASKYLK